jgi:hypothetical protein
MMIWEHLHSFSTGTCNAANSHFNIDGLTKDMCLRSSMSQRRKPADKIMNSLAIS